MKNRSMKRKEKIKIQTEENDEIIRFVKVLGVVIVCVVSIYFFTRAFITKDLFENKSTPKEEEIIPATIDYKMTALGSLLTRPYKDYYVLAFSFGDKKASYYEVIGDLYRESEDSIKLYYADLASPLNSSFYDENVSTPKATSVDELKVGDLTLIKISNSKIVKFIEDIDEITTELKPKEKW